MYRPTRKPLTEDLANRIFDLLVEIAIVDPALRTSFVKYLVCDDPHTELRVCGALGLGGKFRYPRHGTPKFYVECYPEDKTDARRKILDDINPILKQMAEEFFNG